MRPDASIHPSLAIAVSSRALFDTEDSHAAFTSGGLDGFTRHERENAGALLEPGPGFELVRRVHHWGKEAGVKVTIAVVSRRDPVTGGRILRSLAHHGIDRVEGCFTNGATEIVPYVQGFGADLFLSRDAADVQAAVDLGIPAAQMTGIAALHGHEELRLAFDGDAVLFSHETERHYLENGLEAFLQRENELFDVPLEPGPLLPFVRALDGIQKAVGRRLFRTALTTARQGYASERAIRTLAGWGLAFDEAHFCGDTPKAGLLRAFRPHIFFDDSDRHIGPASDVVGSGKVPWRRAEPAEAG